MFAEGSVIYAVLMDVLYAVAVFIVVLIGILLSKLFPTWIARKVIHVASAFGALMYMFYFNEPYVYTLLSIMFTVWLYIKHVKGQLENFQIRGNYGEVLYCAAWAFLSLLWQHRLLAGLIMLYMAIGDAVTGVARFYVSGESERNKHWSGSVAMLIATYILTFVLLYYVLAVDISKTIIVSAIMSLGATLCERQPIVDDNIMVPFASLILGLHMTYLFGIPW